MINYDLMRAAPTIEDYELWRREALVGIRAERARLLCQLLGMDEETLTTRPVFGQTTAKDLLAHIAAWDERHRDRLVAALSDRSRAAGRLDLDEWNASVLERRRDWSLAKVVQILQEARDAFIDAMNRAEAEAFHHSPDMTWAESLPPRTWVLARARHDANHATDLLRWRRQLEDEGKETFATGPRSVLLAAMRSSRAEIGALVALAPAETRDARPVVGDWNLRDVVGHLADWDQFLVDTLVAGRLLDMGHGSDVQKWNEAHADARQKQPWATVWSDYQRTKDSLVSFVQESPTELLAEPLSNPWGEAQSKYQLIVGWLEHEREHAGELRAALSDPDLL